jgi:hypothetical protein
MDPANHKLIGYAVTGAIVALVLFLRMRALTRERRLRLELMWIVPVIMLVAAAALFLQYPPHGTDWLWLAVIFAAGAGLGWWRGRLIPITVDPDTHLLNTKPSPAALLFLLALFVVRFGLRGTLTAESASWRISPALVTDGFVVFSVGLFSISRLEMALRAWRLLGAARAAKALASAQG